MKTTYSLYVLLFSVLCGGLILHAQETRGTLSGLVSDPSGAAVPGVAVTATEVRTGVKTATVSDSAGQYNIPFLAPGDYELSAEAKGFKSIVRRGINLESSGHPVIDIQLAVGAVSDSVEVTSETPLVDTANSSMAQAITTKQVEDFPLNGRNPMMVAQLAIGVVATANPSLVHPFDNGAASAWSIGGTPSQTAEILMDGAPNATWDNRVAYSPMQDAVQEVKVKAFDPDAAYGHTSGGTINEVMKTGTNSLHGSAYWFDQPSALSANNFFNNLKGTPNADTKFNQWGGTIGGPLVVPKVLNGRNKLFWFFGVEKLSDSQPDPRQLTVPTDAERTGDFTALLSSAGGTDCITGANGAKKTGFNCYQLFNPYSGTLSGSTVSRKPFMCDASGNPLPVTNGTQGAGTACNKLPQSLLNQVALNYLKFYPEPNITGNSFGQFNYGNATTTNDDYSNELGRLDWDMSQRSRMAFNIRHNNEFQIKQNYFNNDAHGLGTQLFRENWGGSVDEVFTISPTLIFDVRGNYTRMYESHPSITAGFDPTTLGYPSYIGSNSQNLTMPQVAFGTSCGNSTTLANSFECLGQTGADLEPSQSVALFGDVEKEYGKHTLKFGADARQYKLDAQSFGSSSGSYSFAGTSSGSWTSGSTTNFFGQDFANFLLGLPTSGSFDLTPRGTYTAYYYAGFGQDDWRIRSDLTLNLGIRYDLDAPYVEKLGRTVNGFDPTATNPIAAAAIAAFNSKTASKMPIPVNFNVPGGLTFPDPSNAEVYQIDNNLPISPRAGFAWSPARFGNKTVIRGGFGIFKQSIAMSQLNPIGTYSSTPILAQEGFKQTTSVSVPSNFLQPAATLSNPFPAGFLQPIGSSAGLATFNGQNVSFLAPVMTNPYSERWTFGIQHEIARNTVLEIDYIGNHGVHLPISFTQLDGIPRQYLSTLPYRDSTVINTLSGTTVPNPFAGLLPGASGGLNSSTIAAMQLLAPYPQYPVASGSNGGSVFSSGLVEQNATIGSSYFNSLNAKVERHLANGLQLTAVYIWSKLMERDSWLNDTDPAPEKRISPFDHTHRFVTAIDYDLPIGRGKLVNTSSGFLNALVGGWQLNGIYTFQTGQPLLWMNGSSNNPGDYPLCAVATTTGACPIVNGVPDAATSLPIININPRQWSGPAFDTSQFITSSSQLFRFHIRTFPSTISSVRQDGTNNLDASILKSVHLTESKYVQLRMEAFNVLNHPTFGAPNVSVTSGTSFGTITTQANRPRQLQVGVRFVF